MKCKFCFAEFEEGLSVCPVCGKSLEEELQEETVAAEIAEETVAVEEDTAEESMQAEETDEVAETATEEAASVEAEEAPAVKTKKKPKAWQIVLAIAGCVALIAVLVCAVFFGDKLFRANDIFKKDSYTVDNKVVEKRSENVVATMGNQELRISDLQIHYWLSVSNFLNEYGSYLSYMGFDVTKPLDEQLCNPDTGMTFQQMFLQSAIDDWLRYATLVQLSEDNGYVLTEEDKNYLDTFKADLAEMAESAGYEDLDLFVSENLAPGSTYDAYIAYNYRNYIGITYYDSIYETMIPSNEEAEAYFAEHEDEMTSQGYTKDAGSYYYVRHILLSPKGGSVGENGQTVYTEDEWEECRATAQKMLDEFLAGEATEDAFAELARTNSADTGSSSNGGMYEMLTKNTNFVEEFKNWYLDESRKPGDTGLVKSIHGYHIMYFSSSEPIWQFETKATMLADNTVKLLADAQEKWPLEIDYSKIALGFLDLSGYGNQSTYSY